MIYFTIDRLNESNIHSRQSDNVDLNNNRFKLLSPLVTNLSVEGTEYDPLSSMGQKGWKLRTAGNSPAITPSKQMLIFI